MGLTLTSSDPSRVAVPERWASFTLPAGITTGTVLFTVDVLGEDGDSSPNDVTLTLGRGTDGNGAGFPAGWRIGSETQLLRITDLRRVVGFATPATDGIYDNFDEENFRINAAESSGTVLLPIRTNINPPTGGLPLTVTIAQNDDNVFSFTDAPGTNTHSFAIPEGEKEYNLQIGIREDDNDTDTEIGRFVLSLGANPPDDYQNEVTRNEITVWSIDDDGEEGFVIFEGVTESPFGSPVEYFEPRPGDADADTDDHFNALAVTRYVNLLFSALPRPTTTTPEPGFNLETTFSSPGTAGAAINTAPGGVSAPDVRLPTTTFIPMDEILIRPNGFLYRLPITVFSDSKIINEEEREDFRLEIVKNQTFPPGIAGRRIPYTHLGTIIDRSGVQVEFGENDRTLSGGEIRNPSTVDESAGTINIRVNAIGATSSPTPLKWRVERAVDADGHELSSSDWEGDLASVRGEFSIPGNVNFADFTLSINNDTDVEGDETYTLILEEGTGFSNARGSRIVPGKNRYTFTITDDDAAIDTVFGFAGTRTEVAEDGSEITISFSLTEDGVANNALIPAGGICLILETGGTTSNDDIFHLDTSRSAATGDPAPNCDPARGTSGAVDAAVGASAIAEYIPAGQAPDMRLRINDETDPEIKEEITFTIRAMNNGLPRGWKVGQSTHTVAIAANDNLISFAEKTSRLTESREDLLGETARPSREVTVNITQAVPAEEITGPNKTITLQVDIETLSGTGTDADITVEVAPSASGSSVLDPTSGILTVNAGIDQVPLIITAVDDEIMAELVEEVTITISKVAGVVLPRGWVVDINDGNNVHTVSVVDDDYIFVEFGEEFKDGLTLNENANWIRRTFVTRTNNANVPKHPDIFPGQAHTTFRMRLRVDDSDPQFGYVGISARRPENSDYDSNKTFQEQGYSQAILDFVNNDFASGNNGRMSLRTSDNVLSEGPQDVNIFLELAPGSSLPPGWRIGERDTLTVTVNDNENFIRWADGNSTEFTEGQGAIELKLYATAGGVTIGTTDTSKVIRSRARLLDKHGNALPVINDNAGQRFNVTEGSFGVQFPRHRITEFYLNDVYANFTEEGEQVIGSRYFPAPTHGFNPQNLNNGKPYTLVIGEDNNFTDDVLIYEIHQVSLSDSGWGRVSGHPLRWRFTVRDNDIGGIISFAESESSAAEARSTPVTISIAQPLQVQSGVLLNLSSNTGDAVLGTDYTITGTGGAVYDSNTSVLTLPPNMETVTFIVQAMQNSVTGDLSGNLDKRFTITLSEPGSGLPTGWSVSGTENTHTMTIVNNEVQYGFVEQSTTVFEDPMGDTIIDIEFQVTGDTFPADGIRIPMEITGEGNPVLRGSRTMELTHYDVLREVENNNKALDGIVRDGDELFIRAGASSGDNPRLTIKLPNDGTTEPGGTITFTLPASLTSVSGASRTHELKIEPSDGRIFFTLSDDTSTRPEGSGRHAVLIKFDSNSGAPSGGLHFKLEITSGNDDNLVTFNMDGTPNNSKDVTFPAGQTEQAVELYINDNDSVDANPPVILTIMKGDNFQEKWGIIQPDAKIHTLTVVNEDLPTIGFAKAGMPFFGSEDSFDIELEVEGHTVANNFNVDMQVTASVQEMLAKVRHENDEIGENLIMDFAPFTVRPGANTGDNPRIILMSNKSSNPDIGETLTFTLPDSVTAGSTTLMADANAKTHTLTLERGGGFAWFPTGADTGSVSEGGGSAKFSLSLNNVPAPSTGLPLKLEITSGNTVGSELVTFTGGMADNLLDFTVDPGETSYEFTVYINDNPNAATNGNQEVVFTLSKGDDYPDGWGSVATSLVGNTYTLTVVDDESPSIGFMSGSSRHSEGTVARIPLVFTQYTIPSGGISLKFDVTGTVDRGDTGSGNPDVQHNGADIDDPFTVNLGASDTAISIEIRADGGRTEGDETLILTLRPSDGLPSGVAPGEITKHTITIPANGNEVFFRSVPDQSMATVTEGPMTEVTIMVRLTSDAPADGLPLKFTITSGNENNLVTFEEDRSIGNSVQPFTVDPGERSGEVTVYIRDNQNDADPDDQVVEFTLSEGNLFPTEWGRVRTTTTTSTNNNIFTLTVVDDEPTSGSAPPRLPDPVRPPRQETSPKSPDEFQKEAKANP